MTEDKITRRQPPLGDGQLAIECFAITRAKLDILIAVREVQRTVLLFVVDENRTIVVDGGSREPEAMIDMIQPALADIGLLDLRSHVNFYNIGNFAFAEKIRWTKHAWRFDVVDIYGLDQTFGHLASVLKTEGFGQVMPTLGWVTNP